MLRAHQLCSLSSHRPAQERASKRAEEAGASQESSTALQDAALCGILLSPSLLSKEIDHFRPSFHQKIACGAPNHKPPNGRAPRRASHANRTTEYSSQSHHTLKIWHPRHKMPLVPNLELLTPELATSNALIVLQLYRLLLCHHTLTSHLLPRW